MSTRLNFMSQAQVNALKQGETDHLIDMSAMPRAKMVTLVVPEGSQGRAVECPSHGAHQTVIREHHRFAARQFPGVNLQGTQAEDDRCPACFQALEKARDGIRAEARQLIEKNERGRWWLTCCESAGIGDRELGYTLNSLVARSDEQGRAIAHCKAMIEALKEGTPAPSLIMLGKPGTGKSLIASAALASALHVRFPYPEVQPIGYRHKDGLRGLYVSAAGMFRMIRATWSKDSKQSEGDVLERLYNLDLLVIDEMGIQAGSENETQIMFDVLDGRHRAMKPTIFLSNLPLDELKLYLGERVMSRLRQDGGKLIAFNGEDQRGV